MSKFTLHNAIKSDDVNGPIEIDVPVTITGDLEVTGDLTVGGTVPGGAAAQLDANGTILDVNAINDGEFLKRVGTAVVSAAGGGGIVESASHDFTAAELLLADVTPIEMIPAPGLGFAIVALSIVFRSIGGAVSYDAGNLELHYGSLGGATLHNGITYPQIGDDLIDRTDAQEISSLPVGDYENRSIVAVNGAADPSVGDGTMSITIFYVTVAV